MQAHLDESLPLVEHDEGVRSRLERVEGKISSLLKSRQESEFKSKTAADKMIAQAETAVKYGKYLDARCFAYECRAHLIQAKSSTDEVEEVNNFLTSVQRESRKVLENRRADFEKLAVLACKAFNDGHWEEVIRHAEISKTCLRQYTKMHKNTFTRKQTLSWRVQENAPKCKNVSKNAN